MKKNALLTILFSGFCHVTFAQPEIIEPISSGSVTSLLSEDKVTSVRILASSDESLNIEIRYEGFNKEDMHYVATGSVLDTRKQKVQTITAEPTELSRNATTVDLIFKMSPGQSGGNPYLDTGFITVAIQSSSIEEDDASGLLDDLSKLLGSTTDSGGISELMGNVYNFEYSKRWRVAGNANMVISATLTPIGKAAQQ